MTSPLRTLRLPSRRQRLGCVSGLLVLVISGLSVRAQAAPSERAIAPDAVGELMRQLADLSNEEQSRRIHSQIRETLANRRFRFCHESVAAEDSSDLSLCFLARDLRAECPQFSEQCRAACTTNPEYCDRSAVVAASNEHQFREWTDAAIQFARRSFWTFLSCVTLGLLWFVGSHARSWRQHPTPEDNRRSSPRGSRPTAARVEYPDPSGMLVGADSASGDGNYERAITLLLQATYWALHRNGKLALAANRTNGEYLDALHLEPELAGPLVEAVETIEAIQFGAQLATRDRYGSIRAQLAPLVLRLQQLVLIAAALSSLSACSEHPDAGWDPAARASGTAMLGELIEGRGGYFHRRTRSVVELGEEVGAIIIHPSARLNGTQWQSLLGWVARGHSLVLVAPVADPADALGMLSGGAPCLTQPHALANAVLDEPLQLSYRGSSVSFSDDAWFPLAACGRQPIVAWRRLGQGGVVLLSGEEMLSNASLSAGDNAKFLLTAIGPARVVHWVDEATGAGTQSPYVAVANAGLIPVVAHLLLAAMVFVVARSRRAYAVHRSPGARPRHFKEHVLAMGRLFSRSQSEEFALATYRRWALLEIRRLLAGQTLLDEGALCSALAVRSGASAAELSSLLYPAPAQSLDPQRGTKLSDLQAIGTLVSTLKAAGS